MNKELILKEMVSELEKREYEYDSAVLSNIVDTSIEAKQKGGLLDLFRQHPNWNEDHLMVHFDADFTRRIDPRGTKDLCEFIFNHIHHGENKYYWQLPVFEFFCKMEKQFFDESDKEKIDYINKLNPEYKLRTNMKVTKAFLKICKVNEWDKIPETYINSQGEEKRTFDKLYSQMCDMMNPLKVKRHTVISINPVDYLLMSNGSNWESCHYIGDDANDAGCYSAGTISYMLDENSFVFYTVNAEYDGDEIETAGKTTRQMFAYKNGTLFQSRLYPQENDYGANEQYKEIRAIVEKVIADCEHNNNLWDKFQKDLDVVGAYIKKGYYACNYPDWKPTAPGSQHVGITKRSGDTQFTKITFGVQPICISCGQRHSCDGNISCCSGSKCECCGRYVDRCDLYWCDDVQEYRCDDCLHWCEDCEQDYGREPLLVHYMGSRGYREDRYVCPNCYERNYRECCECGDAWHEDDVYMDSNGDYYCPDCAEMLLVECIGCCEYVRREDAVEIDGEWYCKECANEEVQ